MEYVQKLITIVDCYDTQFRGSLKFVCGEDIDMNTIHKHINQKYSWWHSTNLYYFNTKYLVPFDLKSLLCDGFSHLIFKKLYAFNFYMNASQVTELMREIERDLYNDNFNWTLIFIRNKNEEYVDQALYSLGSKDDIKYVDEITKNIFECDIGIIKDNNKNNYDLMLTGENVNNISFNVKHTCVIYCNTGEIDKISPPLLNIESQQIFEL